jgi:hypothetical protein
MRWTVALHAALLCGAAGAAELGAARATPRRAAPAATSRIVSDAAGAAARSSEAAALELPATAVLRNASELAYAPAPAEVRTPRAFYRATQPSALLSHARVPCMRIHLFSPFLSHAPALPPPPGGG